MIEVGLYSDSIKNVSLFQIDQRLEPCTGALALPDFGTSGKLLSLSELHLPHCKMRIRKSSPCCRDRRLGEALCLRKEGLVNIIASQFPILASQEAQAVRDVKLLGLPTFPDFCHQKGRRGAGWEGRQDSLGIRRLLFS